LEGIDCSNGIAVVSIATICLFFLFHVILSLPKDLGVPHIPLSLRAKAWQSPGTETRTLLAIDKRRICFRNHYRAENLRYQLKHGQKLPPQFHQIICLVKRTLCGDIEPIAR